MANRHEPRIVILILGVLLAAVGAYLFVTARSRETVDVRSDRTSRTAPASDAELPRDPITGGESRVAVDLYRDLLALARRDRPAFRRRVAELAESDAPRERLDALRAWHEIASGDAVPAIARALADPTADASVREFAYGVLEPRCSGDRRARDAMLGYLKLRPEDRERRSRAFANVLQWGGKDELNECLPLVHDEDDPDVVIAAVEGMRASVVAETRAKVDSLHWRHPNPEVRKRLRTLGIGR